MLPLVATTVGTVDVEELEADVDEELVLLLVFLVRVAEVVGDGVAMVGANVPAVFSKQLQALLTADFWMSASWVGTATVVVERYFGQKVAATEEKRSKARSALFS